MQERIVVTGYGIISSLGIGAEKTVEALKKEERHIVPPHFLDTIHTDLLIGEVPYSSDQLQQMLGIEEEMSRTVLLSMVALREALQTAKMDNKLHTSFINSTTVGGMDKLEEHYYDFKQGQFSNFAVSHDCGTSTEQVCRYTRQFDFATTISTACSSAANAIILGCDLLRARKTEVAVVGGTEALSKFHLNGFNSLMILEKEPCKPFDKESHGLNLGEGAAYLVLERESAARRRGATIICEISGYANTCDAFHQTATSENSIGATTAMQKALQAARLQPSDIDYISTHGTGTSDNDLHESIALKNVFRENIPDFSSTKGFTGHTTSAAGGIEAVISVLCLKERFMPASLGFREPIEATGLTPITHTLFKELHHVMSNSFGFGGNDSVCIFSKYDRKEEDA